MRRSDARWLAILGCGVALECWSIRRHDDGTLSSLIARLGRTETPTGRAAFTVSLAVGAAVLWRHIARFEYSRKAGQPWAE